MTTWKLLVASWTILVRNGDWIGCHFEFWEGRERMFSFPPLSPLPCHSSEVYFTCTVYRQKPSVVVVGFVLYIKLAHFIFFFKQKPEGTKDTVVATHVLSCIQYNSTQLTFPAVQLKQQESCFLKFVLLLVLEVVCTQPANVPIPPPTWCSPPALLSARGWLPARCGGRNLGTGAVGLGAWVCSSPHHPSHQSPRKNKTSLEN